MLFVSSYISVIIPLKTWSEIVDSQVQTQISAFCLSGTPIFSPVRSIGAATDLHYYQPPADRVSRRRLLYSARLRNGPKRTVPRLCTAERAICGQRPPAGFSGKAKPAR